MLDSILKLFVPIHQEGQKFLGIFAAVTVILYLFASSLAWIGLVLCCWCYYFFRDPPRVTPDRDGLVISPADGEVCMVVEASPPVELKMADEPVIRISVFMNVFDCHVNRTPVGGVLSRTCYYPGKFLSAELDAASEENERQAYRVDTPDGQSLAFVQIAGFVARRIIKEAEDGQQLLTGDRIGMIRFGSRVDVYLPKGVVSLASVGQRMVAGETVIADMKSDEVSRIGVVR